MSEIYANRDIFHFHSLRASLERRTGICSGCWDALRISELIYGNDGMVMMMTTYHVGQRLIQVDGNARSDIETNLAMT